MRNLFLEKKQTGVLIFKDNVVIDNQFSSPKQIRWSAALGKLLVANSSGTSPIPSVHIRNADLSFYTKYQKLNYCSAIDADASYIYLARASDRIWKLSLDSILIGEVALMLNGIRMIDASGDPDYIYVTSNNATDGHGVRKVRKSDMTVVASLLATGSGDGQFINPLGCFYHDGYLYVADPGNNRIVKLNASGANLTFDSNITSISAVSPYDLCFDGTNWYLLASALTLYKFDNVFTWETRVPVACVGYSITYIPDQGDGNGATLAVVDNTNSHLARYKCSDLSQVGSDVGSSGTGADSLCDPQVTGPAGIWYDSEDNSYSVASGANISKNGFSGTFFRGSPGWMRYRPVTGGLLSITAIDFSDDKISGEIRNLYKCINLTSLKLQTNPTISLNLSKLPVKLQTIWAYACGAGVFGSIRHMTSATSINLRENGASQVLVDQWIDDLWQNRDVMAVATVNLNGSNAVPSGVYQDATPPTTGLEKVFDLVENYGWTVATT